MQRVFLHFFSHNLKKNHTGKFHSSKSLENAYLTDMIQEIINSSAKVEIIHIEGNWFEIDTMQDIENVREKIGCI